jgi:20S proteasome alpha/beta subunit
MTLVAGFVCSDGLLLCADMEEVSGYTSKRKVNKLWYMNHSDHLYLAVGGAGSSPVLDRALGRIQSKTRGMFNFDLSAMEQVLDTTLKEVHEKYIWPDTRSDHRISLLVGYSDHNSYTQQLWSTHDLVPAPVVSHVCIGQGADLANYFADRLFHYRYSEEQAVRLATFIFREVKEHVQNVGQGTEMCMLRFPPDKDRRRLERLGYYKWEEIASIEATLPDFYAMLDEYGQKLIGPRRNE